MVCFVWANIAIGQWWVTLLQGKSNNVFSWAPHFFSTLDLPFGIASFSGQGTQCKHKLILLCHTLSGKCVAIFVLDFFLETCLLSCRNNFTGKSNLTCDSSFTLAMYFMNGLACDLFGDVVQFPRRHCSLHHGVSLQNATCVILLAFFQTCL